MARMHEKISQRDNCCRYWVDNQNNQNCRKLWCKSFSLNGLMILVLLKNFAKAQAKGDWIVFLNADEYFSDDSIEQVKKYLIEDNKKYDAIICEIVNINSDDYNRIISSL